MCLAFTPAALSPVVSLRALSSITVAMAHRVLPACPPARLSTSACAGLRQQLPGVRVVVTCRQVCSARLATPTAPC